MSAHEPFFGSAGPRTAPIVFLGEAWGRDEAYERKPFVGAAGSELLKICHEAGIDFNETLRLNIIPDRPSPNDDDFRALLATDGSYIRGVGCSPRLVEALDRLDRELSQLNPRVIIACGNYPLWALTDCAWVTKQKGIPTPSGITSWRGSQLYRSGTKVPVLPIIHPSAILRQWNQRAITVHDLRNRVPLAIAGKWEKEPFRTTILPTFAQAKETLSAWLSWGKPLDLGCDIETSQAKIITCIGFSTSSSDAFVIPFVRLNDDKSFSSYWTVEQEAELWVLLGKLFVADHISFIGQNFLYDMAFIYRDWRVVPKLKFDTLVAQNLLFPGSQKDLGYLSSLYCEHHRYWKEDNRDWSTTGTLEQHLSYNAEDCCRMFEIAIAQRDGLKAEGIEHLWENELRSIWFAWRMTATGIRVDSDRRKRIGIQILETRMELLRRLLELVPQRFVETSGNSIWPDSPKQCAQVLYELLRLPEQTHRKTGSVTTDDEAVNTLKEKHPFFANFLEMLLDYRSMSVFYNTFIQMPLEPGNRMSASFNPAGTETFRYSSSKNPFGRGGNMQNIPAGSGEE